MSKIQCPDCGFDTIFVVEAMLTATGEKLPLAEVLDWKADVAEAISGWFA